MALGLWAIALDDTNLFAYKVTIIDQDRIRFSGKGAGAGMMLMSSMGSMGIAVGVAIDEGIGQEVQAAYVASGGIALYLCENSTQM